MNGIDELFSQAELALAAYSVLHEGIFGSDYIDALRDGNGMSVANRKS